MARNPPRADPPVRRARVLRPGVLCDPRVGALPLPDRSLARAARRLLHPRLDVASKARSSRTMSQPGERPMKSFRDLARARGIEPKPDAAAQEGRGFTFDGAGDPEAAYDSEALRHGTAREKIAARPRAFG